jgi:hypothetical protein
MKREHVAQWAVRVSWSLLAGLWGGWLGAAAALRLPPNADSFGTLLAQGLFSILAVMGFVAGLAFGALVGGFAEKLLRRAGLGIAGALVVATLVNALACWQLVGAIQANYPGLGPDAARSPASSTRQPATVQPSADNTCAHPPAENSPLRPTWEAECR